MFNVDAVRAQFPILDREVNGKPLVYLDNGASAQKPQVVIDAITQAYANEYSNVHRGLHYLSNLATDKYESVRGTVARFLNAGSEDEIVLNTGATMGINTVAYGSAGVCPFFLFRGFEVIVECDVLLGKVVGRRKIDQRLIGLMGLAHLHRVVQVHR